MDKDKPNAKGASSKEKTLDYNAPVFILNPEVDKDMLKKQASRNFIAIRAMLDMLHNEAIYQHDLVDLICFFGQIERRANEVQELLITAQ